MLDVFMISGTNVAAEWSVLISSVTDMFYFTVSRAYCIYSNLSIVLDMIS